MALMGLAQVDGSWSDDGVMDAYLRYVDPIARAALNEWLANRGSGHFSLENQAYQLRWSGWMSTQPTCALEFALGSQRLLLSFESLAVFDPLWVGAPFANMPVSMRNLALQHRVARFLALLPGALADTADLRAVHWEVEAIPKWECALGFTLQRLPDGAMSHGVFAVESPQTLAWLNEQLPARAVHASTAPRDVSLTLQIILGHTSISSGDVRALGIGDVVWIDTTHFADDGIGATLFAHGLVRAWPCRVHRNKVCVAVAAPGDVSAKELIRFRRVNVGPRGATAVKLEHEGDLPMNTDLSDFEVPVTFDLGELSVAFEALERIQPGYLFELPQEVANASVALRISGSMIARGQLVAVGRRLGVRITNLMRTESDS